jgi:hypothetical protein
VGRLWLLKLKLANDTRKKKKRHYFIPVSETQLPIIIDSRINAELMLISDAKDSHKSIKS